MNIFTTIAQFICMGFSYILITFLIYFIFIIIISMFKNKEIKNTYKKLKYAVLLPARNEEKCINNIINSIKNQSYPSNLIDIYVLPNNCTDNTENVVKKLGVNIIEMPKDIKSKGTAIGYAINLLLSKDYDAFLVFDADNKTNKDFILEINKAFANGADIVKSKIFAQDNDKSVISSFYDIHFCIANRLINKPRHNLGIATRIIGTGFGMSTNFLKSENGFNVDTLTEDVEFYVRYATKGVKSVFVEKAIVYDEEPNNFATTLIQRKRWMSGIMQVFIYKLKDIFKGMKTLKSFANSLDVFVQLCFSYLQAYIPFVLILSTITYKSFYINNIIEILLNTYLIISIVAIFVLVSEKRFKFNKYIMLSIFLYPLFVFSFIPLQTISLFKKTKVWREIRHKGEEIDFQENEYV